MKKIVTNNDYNKWSIEWLVVLTNHKDPWLGYYTSTQVLMLLD
jgi:hypothetical protein